MWISGEDVRQRYHVGMSQLECLQMKKFGEIVRMLGDYVR